jgi:hypothetical protein
MEVIVTEWGLQSYIKLKGKVVFSDNDYRSILRPDAELLKGYPNDPKFSNSKFWGPAKFANKITKYGHKMKWHNFGNGNVQLRLCVVIVETEIEDVKEERAFLCTSYVKDNKSEKLEMAGLKTKIRKILDGTYVYRGRL